MPRPPEAYLRQKYQEQFVQGFRRSRKGNLWRDWDGVTCTVFARMGRYVWCVADEAEVTYSRERFETEEEALWDLASEMVP